MSYSFSGATQFLAAIGYNTVNVKNIGTTALSISAWVKHSSGTIGATNRGVVTISNNSDTYDSIYLYGNTSNAWGGNYRGTGTPSASTGGSVGTSWTNLIVTVSTSRIATLYINNSAQSSGSADTAGSNNTAAIEIGNYGNAGWEPWAGKIAHVAVYEGVLDASARANLQLYTPDSLHTNTVVTAKDIWPLTANANATVGAYNLTVTGATLDAGDNPSITAYSGASAVIPKTAGLFGGPFKRLII